MQAGELVVNSCAADGIYDTVSEGFIPLKVLNLLCQEPHKGKKW